MDKVFRCYSCGRLYDNADACPECGCPAAYMQDKGMFPDDVKKGYMFDETLNEIFNGLRKPKRKGERSETL